MSETEMKGLRAMGHLLPALDENSMCHNLQHLQPAALLCTTHPADMREPAQAVNSLMALKLAWSNEAEISEADR